MNGADAAPDAAPPDRDPGLQPERTRLAWRRTTLSGTVVAVLAAKAALHGGATPLSVLAVSLCCVLWLAFLLIAHGRIRTLASANRPPALPRRTPPRRPVHTRPRRLRGAPRPVKACGPMRSVPALPRNTDHVPPTHWTAYRPVGIMCRVLFTCPRESR
ncbi:DUF202 domain-containing protein [Streptomyces violaceoruber]